MPEIRLVGENVYLIDDLLYSIPGLGAVYLLREERVALIDSGPASSVPTVLEAVRKIGVKPEEVDYLILTHIHLDHGGGAGALAREMPRAKVVAHPSAVKHLIDPSRLKASSLAALGREALLKNGEMLPLESDSIIPGRDLERIQLSRDQVLTLIESPGHAPHALCIGESRHGGVFVGDCVGHYVEGSDVIVPITPPPAFDLALYLRTLKRLKSFAFSRIYFPHSGVSSAVEEKLDAAAARLAERSAVIEEAWAQNQAESAAENVVRRVCAGLGYVKEHFPRVYDYWASVDIPMSAREHVRYLTKSRHLR